MIALRKILVAVDFTDGAKPVLDYGRTLADACGASLYLLHVITPPLEGPDIDEEARARICSRLRALLEPQDLERRHAAVACAVGTPAPEISRHAAENGVDLIVMGTHRHGPTFRMTAGSVAESVMGLAPCAVLAVKSTTEAAREPAFDPVSESDAA